MTRFRTGDSWNLNIAAHITAFQKHYNLNFRVDQTVTNYFYSLPNGRQCSEDAARGVKFQFNSDVDAQKFARIIFGSPYHIAQCNGQTWHASDRQYDKREKRVYDASVILRDSILRADLRCEDYNEIDAFIKGIKGDPAVKSILEQEAKDRQKAEKERKKADEEAAKRAKQHQEEMKRVEREGQLQAQRAHTAQQEAAKLAQRDFRRWELQHFCSRYSTNLTIKFEKKIYSNNILRFTFQNAVDKANFNALCVANGIFLKQGDNNTFEIETPNLEKLGSLPQQQPGVSSSSSSSAKETEYEQLVTAKILPSDLAFFVSAEEGSTLDVVSAMAAAVLSPPAPSAPPVCGGDGVLCGLPGYPSVYPSAYASTPPYVDPSAYASAPPAGDLTKPLQFLPSCSPSQQLVYGTHAGMVEKQQSQTPSMSAVPPAYNPYPTFFSPQSYGAPPIPAYNPHSGAVAQPAMGPPPPPPPPPYVQRALPPGYYADSSSVPLSGYYAGGPSVPPPYAALPYPASSVFASAPAPMHPGAYGYPPGQPVQQPPPPPYSGWQGYRG